MGGRPSAAVARERERLVMAQQKEIWKRRAARLVGREFRALVVAPGVARLPSQAPDVDGVVYLEGSLANAPVGAFVDVELLRRSGFDFIGTEASRPGKGKENGK